MVITCALAKKRDSETTLQHIRRILIVANMLWKEPGANMVNSTYLVYWRVLCTTTDLDQSKLGSVRDTLCFGSVNQFC